MTLLLLFRSRKRRLKLSFADSRFWPSSFHQKHLARHSVCMLKPDLVGCLEKYLFPLKPEVFLSGSRCEVHLGNLCRTRFGICSHVCFLLQAISLECTVSMWDRSTATSCLGGKRAFRDVLMLLGSLHLF